MKKRSLVQIVAFALLLGGSGCTHEDDSGVTIPSPEIEYGDLAVNTTDLATGWAFDKAHSNITWETAYLGSSALLTGRFNSFSIDLKFIEDNPAASSLVGKVTLSSVNTGEPGRDGGCLLRTFGTDVSDEAVFTSNKIEFDGQGGYIVTGTLDFHGQTSTAIMKMDLVGSEFFGPESGLSGAPFTVVGFSGEFEIMAKTNHQIESANISDLVKIRINAQFKRKEI